VHRSYVNGSLRPRSISRDSMGCAVGVPPQAIHLVIMCGHYRDVGERSSSRCTCSQNAKLSPEQLKYWPRQ
jgi:hypothetical protein